MNKQIEEMANDYYEAMLKARGTIWSMNEGAPKWYAKELYAKGYRKSTDVAREIFEEIEKLKHTKYDWNDYVEWDTIAELKKKYESEGADDESEL